MRYIFFLMEMLGPVLIDVVLPIPPVNFVDRDETLGPVLMDVVLPIPPVELVY